MNPPELNQRIRQLTEAFEKSHAGSRAHGERVAVYAVATAHHLGFSGDGLLHVRMIAQLGELPPEMITAEFAGDFDPACLEVVALCRAFDRLRSGYQEDRQRSDSEVVRWLEDVSREFYPNPMVDALLAVQGIIQPIGT